MSCICETEWCENHVYYRTCSQWKGEGNITTNKNVITNADNIRSMTDEKLAECLVDIGWDCSFCSEHERLENEPLLRGEKCDDHCIEHCLEWLRKKTNKMDNKANLLCDDSFPNGYGKPQQHLKVHFQGEF